MNPRRRAISRSSVCSILLVTGDCPYNLQARKALLERLRLRKKQKAELATKKSEYPSLQRELLVGSWNSLH
jgi:hypothetical protein